MKHPYSCDIQHHEMVDTRIPEADILAKMSLMLKITADQTRLKILYALLRGPMCVCDIQEAISASQSLVSHQLRILRDNDLVRCQKIGNRALYSVSDDHIVILLSIVHEHVQEEVEK